MSRYIPLCFLALVSSAFCQITSTPPPNVPLRPVINAEPAQPEGARYELTVGMNEKRKEGIAVPLTNPAAETLTVQGIQSSPGLFVVDFPSKVKVGGSEPIDLIYEAQDNTDGGSEIIRVKTDRGIITIYVVIKRDPAVTLTTRELKWKPGAAPEAQYVTVKTLAEGLELIRAKPSAGGHKAAIEKVDGTTYRVAITPASTAKVGQFAVALEFNKSLPGQAAVIYGSVTE